MWGSAFLATLVAAMVAAGSVPAEAAQLQRPTDCRVGMRVKDHGGQTGTVTRFDASWSYCYVRMDASGAEVGYLYSLLDSADAAGAKPQVGGLPSGVYECYGNGEAVQAPVRITGANRYELGGSSGSFSISADRHIVWQSGPLKGYSGKVLSDGRIGIGDSAEDFYPTSCDLNRTLH